MQQTFRRRNGKASSRDHIIINLSCAHKALRIHCVVSTRNRRSKTTTTWMARQPKLPTVVQTGPHPLRQGRTSTSLETSCLGCHGIVVPRVCLWDCGNRDDARRHDLPPSRADVDDLDDLCVVGASASRNSRHARGATSSAVAFVSSRPCLDDRDDGICVGFHSPRTPHHCPLS